MSSDVVQSMLGHMIVPRPSMNIVELNNLVVSLRTSVKKSRAQVIQRLVKQIKLYRNKKGSETQTAENAKRADRLHEEIVLLKKAKVDEVVKHCLANTSTVEQVASQCKVGDESSGHLKRKVYTRVACHKLMSDAVTKWRTDRKDWEELAAFLLSKNTGRRYKKKKQKFGLVKEEGVSLENVVKEDSAENVSLENDNKLNEADESKKSTVLESDTRKHQKQTEKRPKIMPQNDAKTVNSENVNSENKDVNDDIDDDDDDNASDNVDKDEDASDNDDDSVDDDDDDDDDDSDDNDDDGSDGFDSEAYDDYSDNVITKPKDDKISNKLPENAKSNKKAKLTYSAKDLAVKAVDADRAKSDNKVETDRVSGEAVIRRVNLEVLSEDLELPVQTDVAKRTAEIEEVPVKKRKKDSFFLREGPESSGESEEEKSSESENDDEDDDDDNSEEEIDNRGKTKSKTFTKFNNKDKSAQGKRFDRNRDNFDSFKKNRNFKDGNSYNRNNNFPDRQGNNFNKNRNAGGFKKDKFGDMVKNQKIENAKHSKFNNKSAVTSKPIDDKPLHPSWEASRKRKEMQNNIATFTGKKIKFDDD